MSYAFKQEESPANGHLLAGHLAMAGPEILRRGDCRPIKSGSEFIHALFHLERPSMTLVVRNRSSGLSVPQYDYRLPGLGYDRQFVDDRLAMRLRGLRALRLLDAPRALSEALELMTSVDLWTASQVCDDWVCSFGAFRPRCSDRTSEATPFRAWRSARTNVRRRNSASSTTSPRRGMLRKSHHRLFLALMINLPDRQSIDFAIDQLFPGADPDELIIQWVRELASPEFRGASGLVVDPDDLIRLEARLAEDGTGVALDAIAANWKPPPLLEKLFS